jgi:hypothetical protein
MPGISMSISTTAFQSEERGGRGDLTRTGVPENELSPNINHEMVGVCH